MDSNFFYTSYFGGTHGTAKSAKDFFVALLKNNIRVRLITPQFNAEQIKGMLDGKNIDTQASHIPLRRKAAMKKVIFFRPRSLYRFFREQLQRLNYIRNIRNNRDTVIVNGWASMKDWLYDKKYFHGRKGLIVRESPRHFADNSYGINITAMVQCLSEFDFLIFVSSTVQKEWKRFKMLDTIPAYYLPNCCEEEKVEEMMRLSRVELRKRNGFKENDFVLIHPGAIEYRKGQDITVDAVLSVIDKFSSLKVVFLGSPNGEWGRLFLQNPVFKNFPDVFIHISAQPSALEYMYISDLLIFPSRAEAMPRTVLEAMALKLPVVASNADGIPELLHDQQSGLIYNLRQQPDDLGKLILQMAGNHEQRKSITRKAYAAYHQQFSRKRQVERLGKILKDISCI